MKIFVLEDNPSRIKLFKDGLIGHDVDIAVDKESAMGYIKSNKYDLMFLDHDLGGEQFVSSEKDNTGYGVAKEIPETINRDTKVVVHSMNPVGAKNMIGVLSENEPLYRPFSSLNLKEFV